MTNKTVFITGASTGLGHAAAVLFREKGWNVVATMRTPRAIDGCFVVALDVQDEASIGRAVKAGIEKFGSIDVVINNAGFSVFGVFESVSPKKVLEQFEVNVFGVMNVTRAVLPHFRARKSGMFVNVSSGAGVFTFPMLSLYHASKFALEGFSESLAYELGALGIGVKIVEPGGVATKFDERTGSEMATLTPIADYAPFVDHTMKLFAGLSANRHGDVSATPEKIAQVMFDAATDGTAQLRYVATDAIKPLVQARRTAGEEGYIKMMRQIAGGEGT